MDWDDLRFFLALARAGTVSGAGKALGVNHTTVSRRVTALEDKLGTRLFDRTGDGYRITQAGEELLGLAEQMEETANTVKRRAAGRDAELTGRLSVTMPYDFANNVVLPGFQAFLDRFPGISVALNTSTTRLDLTAREADLAVRLTAAPPEHLVGRKLLPMRHGLYVSPDYWAAHAGRPSLILFGAPDRPEWATQHFPDAPVALRTDNVGSMLVAVMNGFGIARLPCFIGDAEASVRRLDRPMTLSDWGVWSLNHVDLRDTAKVRVCREFLQEQILSKQALILGENSVYL